MPSGVAVSHPGGEIPYLNSGLQLACWRVFVTNWTKRREQGHEGQHVSVGRSSAAPARRGFLRRARQLPQHAAELVRRYRSLGLQHLAGRHLHRHVPAADGGVAEADRRPAARGAGERPARIRRLRQPASRGADRPPADGAARRLRPRGRVHRPGDRRLPRGPGRRPGRHDGVHPVAARRSGAPGTARAPARPARRLAAGPRRPHPPQDYAEQYYSEQGYSGVASSYGGQYAEPGQYGDRGYAQPGYQDQAYADQQGYADQQPYNEQQPYGDRGYETQADADSSQGSPD